MVADCGGMRPAQPGNPLEASVMAAMPLRVWLRPVRSVDRVGELDAEVEFVHVVARTLRALEAVMDGFEVLSMDQAAEVGDLFCTATGDKNVIARAHLERNGVRFDGDTREIEGMVRLATFLFISSFIGFSFYLGRMLRHLDPSKAIPARVRSA